ncbi:MAG: UDP-N-acetylglucosamine 2-epimerase (hydrolyzing) [Planctomycetota bacterium]|nr:MAG: UDP-N-acetylglucosamine 2-epimerase (hydrolyzing) [Planctomycetota bacterium]
MIGDGWVSTDEERRRDARPTTDRPRRIAVVTGTRAEFGLLTPVMHAIRDRADCELLVIAAGSHLVQPGLTFREVKAKFDVADSIPMQTAGKVGRWQDVESLGKGIGRFGRSFERLRPDWVVVLGDRIEAFAAASAACVGGIAVAHIHGGDRAEGVADEAMRHAITKLAHLHLAATEASAERIRRMGEREDAVMVVGSPAVDGLAAIPAMDDAAYEAMGSPKAVMLMHPIGRTDEIEEHAAHTVLEALDGVPVVALHPNLDPGRGGIMRALLDAPASVRIESHLERAAFVGLLKRVASEGGALVGNSSAGLIEAAAIGCPSVDVGDRQAGRERCEGWTAHAPEDAGAIREAFEVVIGRAERGEHPYGDGKAGVRIARALAERDPHAAGLTRKRCVY